MTVLFEAEMQVAHRVGRDTGDYSLGAVILCELTRPTIVGVLGILTDSLATSPAHLQ